MTCNLCFQNINLQNIVAWKCGGLAVNIHVPCSAMCPVIAGLGFSTHCAETPLSLTAANFAQQLACSFAKPCCLKKYFNRNILYVQTLFWNNLLLIHCCKRSRVGTILLLYSYDNNSYRILPNGGHLLGANKGSCMGFIDNQLTERKIGDTSK